MLIVSLLLLLSSLYVSTNDTQLWNGMGVRVRVWFCVCLRCIFVDFVVLSFVCVSYSTVSTLSTTKTKKQTHASRSQNQNSDVLFGV